MSIRGGKGKKKKLSYGLFIVLLPDMCVLGLVRGLGLKQGYRHSDNTSCLSVTEDISDTGSVMKLALSWSLSLSTS